MLPMNSKRLFLLAIALRTPLTEQQMILQQLQAIAFRQSFAECDRLACMSGISGGCWRFDFAIAVMVEIAIVAGAVWVYGAKEVMRSEAKMSGFVVGEFRHRGRLIEF